MRLWFWVLSLVAVGGCSFDPSAPPANPDANPGTPVPRRACDTNPAYTPNPDTGRRYRAVDQIVQWDAARAACVADEADLVVIGDAEENDYVFGLLGRDLWIGLIDTEVEGEFLWVDGESMSFENWDENEPNDANGDEDYVELVDAGRWNDIYPTDNNNRFVCECP